MHRRSGRVGVAVVTGAGTVFLRAGMALASGSAADPHGLPTHPELFPECHIDYEIVATRT